MLCAKRVAVCCGFAIVILAADLALCGEEFPPSEARSRATAVTGLSAKAIKSASPRTVTDASAPFEVKDVPVWEVAFEGVRLARNSKINSLRV